MCFMNKIKLNDFQKYLCNVFSLPRKIRPCKIGHFESHSRPYIYLFIYYYNNYINDLYLIYYSYLIAITIKSNKLFNYI